MLLKWLLVIAVIIAVYVFFIKKGPILAPKEKKDPKPSGDDMVECKSCGVYISLDEALLKDGEYYCSNECLKA